MRNQLTLLLLIACTTPGLAQDDKALVRYVDSVANAAVAEHRTAGVSIAVVRKGKTILAKGYGMADIENDVPATPQTVYRVGSITKQFTAAAIMRLMEHGKLSLDDTLQKFFPNYPAQGNRVTVRHLLTHTSGIRSYTGMGPRWARTMRLDVAPDSLMALFANEPFDFKPGERWAYDNSGYFLLGMIIEKVSGKPYGRYLQEEFFTPLGLTGTIYCDQAPIIRHRAQGYEIEPPSGRFINAPPLSMTQPYAAGSLCSTVTDLATWTQALAGGRVVSPMSYKLMSTPGTLNDGKPHTYGFGLSIGSVRAHRQVSHGGGINGFISELHHYPDDSLITVVLTNTGVPTAAQLEKLIARRVLGVKELPTVPLSAAELARYTGEYTNGPQRVKLAADSGRLSAQPAGAPTPLYWIRHVGGGRFVREDNDEVTHDFAAGTPSPSFVRTQFGVVTTWTRVP